MRFILTENLGKIQLHFPKEQGKWLRARPKQPLSYNNLGVTVDSDRRAFETLFDCNLMGYVFIVLCFDVYEVYSDFS